jgi:ketosteroid isomerase-like protein
MTITPEGVPEPIHDQGKFIEIHRRQSDGSWLIMMDIFNTDLPMTSTEGEHAEGQEPI